MEQAKLATLVVRFKRLLSEGAIHEIGREVRFCKRERIPTPYRLAMSLLVSFATMRVPSGALHCTIPFRFRSPAQRSQPTP